MHKNNCSFLRPPNKKNTQRLRISLCFTHSVLNVQLMLLGVLLPSLGFYFAAFFTSLFPDREVAATILRTLSKTSNLEPTPWGFEASEVSDLPPQQHYRCNPSVATYTLKTQDSFVSLRSCTMQGVFGAFIPVFIYSTVSRAFSNLLWPS